MRQLLPTPLDNVDPAAAYASDHRRHAGSRPWVMVDMITSADGATAVEGRSRGLGGPGDKAVFRSIRALADVILVGAGTARAEVYGPPVLPAPLIEQRRARGQADLPRLAVVSRRLELDRVLDPMTPGGIRPIVVTTTEALARHEGTVPARAEVIACGERAVDFAAVLAELRRRHGADVVVAEGGPALNAALFEADLIDEWCLTLSPTLVGGGSARGIAGAQTGFAELDLDRVLEEDGFLFLRLVRRRGITTSDRDA